MKKCTIQLSSDQCGNMDMMFCEIIRIALGRGLDVQTEQGNFRLHILYADGEVKCVVDILDRCRKMFAGFAVGFANTWE